MFWMFMNQIKVLKMICWYTSQEIKSLLTASKLEGTIFISVSTNPNKNSHLIKAYIIVISPNIYNLLTNHLFPAVADDILCGQHN